MRACTARATSGASRTHGEVEFLGRIDSQVKIRGYRIELGEIEAVILEDPDVKNAIVSTVPVGQPAQDIAAYIMLVPGCGQVETVKERLALELRRRLPVYMVPAYIDVLDAIPMLASGKADRKALPEPKSARLSIRTGDYVAPETDCERKLAAAWAVIFGREDISVTDDFFLDLGGHSLFAAQAVSKLRTDAGLSSPERGGPVRESEHPGSGSLRGPFETGRRGGRDGNRRAAAA